jgi:hypothetical protein
MFDVHDLGSCSESTISEHIQAFARSGKMLLKFCDEAWQLCADLSVPCCSGAPRK